VSEFRDAFIKIIKGEDMSLLKSAREMILADVTPLLNEFEEQFSHIENHEACIATMTKAFDEALQDSQNRADEQTTKATEKNAELTHMARRLREEDEAHKKALKQRMRWIGELQEKITALEAFTVHPNSCALFDGSGPACTCGLSALTEAQNNTQAERPE